MPNLLAVNYLGMPISSPVIVGACPLTIQPETARQFVDAGAGAIVMPSMMQEQIVYRRMLSTDPLGAIEKSGYQPQQDNYNGGAENYLHSISSLRKTCRVPIIASLNGFSSGDWLEYASEIESAGADALELNLQSAVYDPNTPSDEIEANLCGIVAAVAERVSIPIAAKINQRFTNLGSMARQVQQAGALGIVLFTHLPHWDVCTDRVHWTIRWELSPLDSLGGILEGVVRVNSGTQGMSIAASGGIGTCEDALKAMIAGADVVMVTSAIYRDGPDAIRRIVDGIHRYLELNHHATLLDFQRSRPKADVGPEQMMRLEYVDPLTRSNTYFDPTPTAFSVEGDVYGHMKK